MTEPFYWPVRVYYEDTDAQGIVYYANYLRFMERARTEWLRALGLEQDELREQRDLIFVVVSTFTEYHTPAAFNDELEVGVVLKKAGGASFVMEQNIYRRDASRTLICSGETRAAALTASTRKPARLPTELLSQR
ncbi:MAG: tol-pal system-associated acyl-CoA thioesterase [Pseudomonadota bacterium]